MKILFLTIAFLIAAGPARAQLSPALAALEAAAVGEVPPAPAPARPSAPKPADFPVIKWEHSSSRLTFDGARTYVLDNTTCVVRLGFRQGYYSESWGVFWARPILTVLNVIAITPDNQVAIGTPRTRYIDEMSRFSYSYSSGSAHIDIEKAAGEDSFVVKACADYSPTGCRDIDSFTYQEIYASWADTVEALPITLPKRTYYLVPQYFTNRKGERVYGYVIAWNRLSSYVGLRPQNIDLAELFVKKSDNTRVFKAKAYSLVHALTFIFNGNEAAPAWTVRPMLQEELQDAFNESLGTRSAEVLK